MPEPKIEEAERSALSAQNELVETPPNWPYSRRLQSISDKEGMKNIIEPPGLDVKRRELFEQALKGAAYVGDIRRRFWNLLVENVPKSGFRPPIDKSVKILNIGCGSAAEAFAVNTYFSGNGFGSGGADNVSFIGIDNNPKEIERARREYTKLDVDTFKSSPEHGYTFVLGDATQLANLPEIPQKAQVIIFRHQKISEDKETGGSWSKMFEQARNRLADGGVAIFTSYSDVEHEMLVEKLKQLGYKITVNERNRWARPIENYSEISVDRNVLIATVGK